MMKAVLASVCLVLFGVGMAGAQTGTWSFRSEATSGFARWQDGPDASVEFRCVRTGAPGASPDHVQWWIRAPELLTRLDVAEGGLASIALELDGADGGTGPFVRQGEFVATQIERDSQMLGQLRGAGRLGLGRVSEPAVVTLPLSGLDAALDELLAFCDRAVEQPKPSRDLVDCTAPASRSEETICATPELKALEDRLTAIATEQRDKLEGPPREAFVSDQIAWNKVRRSCGADLPCLRNSVSGRIAYLGRDSAKPLPQPARPAVASDAAPPPLRIPAVQPLAPSQLGSVLYDERQITQRLLIELVRTNAQFLDQEQVLQTWYRVAIGGGKQPQNQTEIAQARDHLSRSVAAQPAGSFLIAQETNNPYLNAQYENGILKSNAGGNNQGKGAPDIGRFQIYISGVGSFEMRASSQFDLSRIQVGAQQAQAMQDRALRLLVVAEISRLHVVGTPSSSFSMLGEGQVRYAALKRPDPPKQRNQANIMKRIDPTLLAVSFAPTAPATPAGGLAAAADALGLSMYQNAVIEGQGQSHGGYQAEGVQALIRLAGLRAHPPEKVGPALRAFTFNVLAGDAERDLVIPPVYVEPNRNPRTISFSRHVDEFDRAELQDRIDRQLWPRVLARMPKAPFEGIAMLSTTLGEYDRTIGGFPIRADVRSMGMAAQGSYPALKALPELLPLPMEKARELVNYLDARFGPGNRRIMLVLRYRVEDVGPVDWEQNSVPPTTITPLTLSLHANDGYKEGEDPFAYRIMDFNIAEYRGETPPEASAERVAFWNEIRNTARSDSDQIALAALGLSEDDAYLDRLVEESNPVRNAGEFDKPAARQAMRKRLASLDRPDKLVLQGSIALGDYSLEEQRYRSTQVYIRPDRGEIGLPQPEIRFADSGLLAQVGMPPDTARIFARNEQRADATAAFVAWVDADLLTTDQRRPVLYVRAERIVLWPEVEDQTGYPPAHVEIAIPEPDVGMPNPAAVAQLEVDSPAMLPIDSEYLDLLMVRARGDSLNEATYLRMMEDRRLREASAAATGVSLAWGRFFDNPGIELTPLQRRDLLPVFTDWTKKRAERLPELAYLQTQGAGMLPPGLQCWIVTPAAQDNFDSYLPAGLAKVLTEMDYRKQAVLLQGFDRTVARDIHRRPLSVYSIYGRPSLTGMRQVRVDNATGACRDRSRRTELPGLDGAARWDAVISASGVYRMPLPREGSRLLRDVGKVEVAEIGPETVRLTLEVQRTEVLEILNTGAGFEFRRERVLGETSLAKPPEALDIFGLAPGDDWDSARAIAADRLPEATVIRNDGPPPNFRRISQNTILGPMPEFQAFRNGHMFLDSTRNEALALIREAERDPERVLAVASYRRFDAAQIKQQQLIGALLQKYGASPETEADESLHGPRPGQTLAWGAREGCLPQMRDQLRPDFKDIQAQPNIRELQTLAGRFRAPGLTYNGAHSIIYSGCGPVVWAFVGEDREGVLHLVVWSMDMALLDEVAQRPDPQAKPDGTDGSQTLIENAAEIDL